MYATYNITCLCGRLFGRLHLVLLLLFFRLLLGILGRQLHRLLCVQLAVALARGSRGRRRRRSGLLKSLPSYSLGPMKAVDDIIHFYTRYTPRTKIFIGSLVTAEGHPIADAVLQYLGLRRFRDGGSWCGRSSRRRLHLRRRRRRRRGDRSRSCCGRSLSVKGSLMH